MTNYSDCIIQRAVVTENFVAKMSLHFDEIDVTTHYFHLLYFY